jgi:hypothetical protein
MDKNAKCGPRVEYRDVMGSKPGLWQFLLLVNVLGRALQSSEQLGLQYSCGDIGHEQTVGRGQVLSRSMCDRRCMGISALCYQVDLPYAKSGVL